MTFPGWGKKYAEIVREFGYDRRLDRESAVILDAMIGNTIPDTEMSGLISGRTVFIVGAGPSLDRSIPVLKRFSRTVMIAADTAARPLLRRGLVPDIISSDLDGDETSLRECSRRGSIMAVHAHADNIARLYLACGFEKCLGTTQSRPYGTVRNFGGFTDGDRAVFLASHFGAENIVLFGMDYEGMIGRHSRTAKPDIGTKLKKLEKSRQLLEWLSESTASRLFTTSGRIRGFEGITHDRLDMLLT